jgi:hypothetical protein
MKTSSYRRCTIVALITAASACSDYSSGPSGSGGNGSGGNSANGGSMNSGGRIGSGGASASGGTVGSGGATATGGIVGSGGADTGGSQGFGGGSGQGAGGDNCGGTSAVSSQGGGAAGASAGGSSGSGGAATGGAIDTSDAGVDSSSSDGNDADAAATDGAVSIAWNAFLPLASGSTDNGAPGTSEDSSGHGYSASYGSGVTFSNSAIVFSGNEDVAIAPKDSVPAVDLTGSYSISVWIRMTDTTDYKTFVSADGSQVSEFYLQKRPDTGSFAFTLSNSDSNDGVVAPCVAAASAVPDYDTPYHLVATRDATTGLNTLYVNGVAAGTKICLASDGVGWPSDTFGIGHGMYNGSRTDYVSGSISRLEHRTG